MKTFFQKLIDTFRQAQINRLVTRAGRRCTRDFKHAIDHIPLGDPMLKHYRERLRLWQEIFWDGSGYRDQLHETIGSLEREIVRLERQVRDLGVEPVTTAPF